MAQLEHCFVHQNVQVQFHSNTCPYRPNIFTYDLRLSVTQNLVSTSSLNRFFIAQSNKLRSRKQCGNGQGRAGGWAWREELVIQWNGENGDSELKFSYLFYKTQLHMELEELKLSGLSYGYWKPGGEVWRAKSPRLLLHWWGVTMTGAGPVTEGGAPVPTLHHICDPSRKQGNWEARSKEKHLTTETRLGPEVWPGTNPHNLRWGRETLLRNLYIKEISSFMLRASCAWNWESNNKWFLSFSSTTAGPPSTSCFPGLRQSHNSNLICLRFIESWFNSVSVAMEHLLNTKFTFPMATQVGQYLWVPAEWNVGPEAWGRDLAITR